MKVNVDPRFNQASGQEIYTGCELLVKGCLETEGGTHLWTGYPGSPVSGFFDAAADLAPLLRQQGIRAAIANNEALAAAMVNGSQMHGLRAIMVQKSVGFHVAADALALGNLVGAHPEGGALVVLGDDPWSDSTQVPADSRYLCKHLMMPVMEPSDPQELKDWIGLGFQVSRESELYLGYLVTTNQADGGGSVEVRSNCFPRVNTNNQIELDTAAIDFERNVLLPPRTWRKEQSMPERVGRLWASARRLGLNRAFPAVRGDHQGVGFVTSAAAFCYLRHALAELGLEGRFPILKVGITYPLDPELIRDFAGGLTDLYVIEERRPFLEEQVVEIMHRAGREAHGGGQAVRVWGKQFPYGLKGIPDTRGLNPSKLIDRIGRLCLAHPGLAGTVDAARLQREVDLIATLKNSPVRANLRTPTFCPGCPHRDSASVLLEIKRLFRDPAYMQRVHGAAPVDLVFHGDTGCYTMLMFEPTKDLMHNYSGMGLGGGTGAGIDPFIRNKQVVFMGDSTFFHSGQLAISNSLKNGQDITYIILDNQTTAMTGHQPTPGVAASVLGESTFAQKIDAIVAGITQAGDTGATLVRLNPAERETYRRLLEQSILQDGVKVVVADKECGITHHRREAREERAVIREHGFLPLKRVINITPEVCEFCLECTKATGCPGLTLENTLYGRKVQIDPSWCVADGACTRFMVPAESGAYQVKACPSFEEVIIRRRQPPPARIERVDFSRLPAIRPRVLEQPWRAYLAGVGGMGIGTATAILVRAAHHEGHGVLFCDKKGLAIRNGGVYSMVTVLPPEAAYSSNIIPYGKADLIIGLDLLEAVRALDPTTNQMVGSRARTAVVVNTHKTPTVLSLLGQNDFQVEQLEQQLRAHTCEEAYFGCDLARLSERFFGTQLYVNSMMLGIACQRGLLPFSVETLEWAIEASLGATARQNVQAFRLGRLVVADFPAVTEAAGLYQEPRTYPAVVHDKAGILRTTRRGGERLASQYQQLVEHAAGQLRLEPESLRDFATRVYDLIQFEDLAYARRYADAVKQIHSLDLAEQGFAATKAAIWGLHRVMAIKDEIYVAHLLTSEEKRRRDAARFDVDAERGDRLSYRHLNRPQLALLGRTMAWDMKSRDWMLRLVGGMRFLRRWLPEWHREEREFRDWYFGLLSLFPQMVADPQRYALFVTILRLPMEVTGYREIRYPKMRAAREQVAAWLAELPAARQTARDLAAA